MSILKVLSSVNQHIVQIRMHLQETRVRHSDYVVVLPQATETPIEVMASMSPIFQIPLLYQLSLWDSSPIFQGPSGTSDN